MLLGWMRNEKGQALVEIALALPLLIILSLGVLEVGRVMHAYLIVTHAAREGARVASLHASEEEIINTAQSRAALSQGEVQVSVTPLVRESGGSVTVQVQYPLEIYAPIINDFLPNPFLVSSEVTMRVE